MVDTHLVLRRDPSGSVSFFSPQHPGVFGNDLDFVRAESLAREILGANAGHIAVHHELPRPAVDGTTYFIRIAQDDNLLERQVVALQVEITFADHDMFPTLGVSDVSGTVVVLASLGTDRLDWIAEQTWENGEAVMVAVKPYWNADGSSGVITRQFLSLDRARELQLEVRSLPKGYSLVSDLLRDPIQQADAEGRESPEVQDDRPLLLIA